MPFAGLNWVPKQLAFAAGLNQRADDRARSESFFDICRDVQFDEMGGIQTRYPFAALSNAIFGGGTLANCRRLGVVNDELVVFTDTALYSWNPQLAKWVNRGTHLGVTIDQEYRFATNGDQFIADRAELSDTIVYCWTEGTTTVNVAAISKTTGAVLMSPTAVTGATFVQARLVALSTKILFFFHDASTNTLSVRALDPADPATGLAAAATTISSAMVSNFDVVRVPGADQAMGACLLSPNTSYLAFTVTAGLSVATSTKVRVCNGRIAVAARPPSGAQMHVFRSVSAGTAVVGDVLTTSTLADVATAQAIGTYTGSFNHLTACYRTVQTAGQFVCVVFWNAGFDPTPGTAFDCKTNTVDAAGTIGTQATFVAGVTIASRAFDYAGSVFLNMIFDVNNATPAGAGPDLNNEYLLYREDRTLHGKAVAQAAGFAETVTVRPGVVSADGLTYYWAGAIRRTASVAPDLGDSTAFGGGKAFVFGARSVVDITISFDSNAGRRMAQIGRTGYLSGSEILQYDGVRLVECGFNAFQYAIKLLDAGAATGSMAAGTYTYKSTFAYINGQGEFERSTTAAFASVVVAAGTSSTTSAGGIIGQLFTSRKTASVPSVEVWRTTVNQGFEAPFYLASSLDPTDTSNPNRHLPNTIAGIPTFTDALADATLATHATSSENGDVLEPVAPPPAKIVMATESRLFLADVAGDPDRIWYSRERRDGEIVAFHDILTAPVPQPGGDITAIAFLNETLIVFRRTAIYALPGDGKDNLGRGQTFGPARTVSFDVGAESQEAVALTPFGLLFKSRKGWHLLDPGGNLRYVGAPVSDFDSETVLAIDVMETQHHVRILTGSRMVVWNYPRTADDPGQWGEWTIVDGLHSVVWNGTHVYLTATGPKQQQATYTSLTYGIDVETAWIKPADLMQGGGAARALQPLGEYRSAHLLRSRIAYNYNPTYVDDRVWTPSPTTVGGPLQFRHGPKRPKCEAIKIRLTAVADDVHAFLFAETALGFNVATDSTRWSAVLEATAPGELGNLVTLSISFVDGVTGSFSIDVRDHFLYDASSGLWGPAVNTIGVVVTMTGSSQPTVLQLEDAITAGTTLATVAIPDTPTKIVAASMIGTTRAATFSGGAFTSPTGEALKLTGLALEVGIERGVFNRLPAAQRQ